MRSMKTRCDNPRCPKEAMPEEPHGKGYVAPYGWLVLKGFFVGTGPNVKVEVCSAECVGPAIAELEAEDRRIQDEQEAR